MPAEAQPGLLGQDVDRSLIDQLFQETRRYRSSKEYSELLEFIRDLPDLAPFNAFLIHMQRPGVIYVANARQWRERFQRQIKDGANPLIILRPFGPVDFVYDVADTEGEPLPPHLIDPFRAKGAVSNSVWSHTIANCARDLIKVIKVEMAAGNAGSMGPGRAGETVIHVVRQPDGESMQVLRPARYRMIYNGNYDLPARYATVAHELAHLYCGHLGTPDKRWWPDRRHIAPAIREFEAESVAYIVCARMGIKNPSAAYLDGYMCRNVEIPDISIETVLKVAGEVERMGRSWLGLRRYDRVDAGDWEPSEQSTTQ